MINIGFSPNIILGFILGFGVILLYLLRIVKPEVARDEDIFFTTIGYRRLSVKSLQVLLLIPFLMFINYISSLV